jgi:nitroreductase
MLTIPDRRADGRPPLSAPEAIAQRRAAAHFHPGRPVPDETLRQVLRLATLAPSGYNLQPWRFLVVRDARNRRKPKVAEAPVVVIVLGYHHPHRSHLDAMIARRLALGALTAPAAAELRARAARGMERVADPARWATRSAMLAAATLMIAAESLGLASAPLEGFAPEQVRPAFGVPDDHTICCLVALGFAAGEAPFPGRFGLDEVCYEEHFGQPWTLGE